MRRPGHYPEGTISIEAPDLTDGAATMEPVHTLHRRIEGAPPMSFALNAATRVQFGGERYLHALVAHKFSNEAPPPLFLTARARQFSSFMLLLGRLGPNRTFDPKHALIIQNKDDLKIPLLVETLPTPKEFKDAIASLSPAQQRFAKAYRSMQLEGSVFGLLVVQLKPALERLLGLPNDALTKEIRLTQQLLELFITYQIPSDLLSYDGEAGASAAEKLEAVRQHVKAIYETLDEAQKAEVAAAKQKPAVDHPGARRAQRDEEDLLAELEGCMADECVESMCLGGMPEPQQSSARGGAMGGMMAQNCAPCCQARGCSLGASAPKARCCRKAAAAPRRLDDCCHSCCHSECCCAKAAPSAPQAATTAALEQRLAFVHHRGEEEERRPCLRLHAHNPAVVELQRRRAASARRHGVEVDDRRERAAVARRQEAARGTQVLVRVPAVVPSGSVSDDLARLERVVGERRIWVEQGRRRQERGEAQKGLRDVPVASVF